MFLIATSVARALEEGGDAVDIEDFRRIFDLKYLHFNPENPFNVSDWASRAGAAMFDGVAPLETAKAAKPKKKRGRPRKKTGATA